MEVHQHSHSPRKKWTHYFWEFLMLFLAVTLGFFVENQREHYIENQRANRFAVSLFEDLQADTAEIQTNNIYFDRFFQATDSLLAELQKPRHLQNDTILQTKGTLRLLVFNYFDPQMGNYEQIKNSGALRYFKQDIVNMLTRYESRKDRLMLQKQEYMDYINNVVTPFVLKIANADFINAYYRKEIYKGGSVFISEPDKEIINQWKNMAIILRDKQEDHKRGTNGHKRRALELMKVLKEEYHLE